VGPRPGLDAAAKRNLDSTGNRTPAPEPLRRRIRIKLQSSSVSVRPSGNRPQDPFSSWNQFQNYLKSDAWLYDFFDVAEPRGTGHGGHSYIPRGKLMITE
jgi:hypothetical protein